MQKENEIFVPVKGTFGRYEVSNFGNIRSVYKNGRGKVLKPHHGNWGYMIVNLSHKKGVDVCGIAIVHRIVAEHFLENPCPEKYRFINHIDGNKLNNVVSNLEWCDHKHNMNHAFKTGLIKKVGERHWMAKFSKECVSEMRERYKTGLFKQKDLALEFGIEQSHASRILRNKTRKYDK